MSPGDQLPEAVYRLGIGIVGIVEEGKYEGGIHVIPGIQVVPDDRLRALHPGRTIHRRPHTGIPVVRTRLSRFPGRRTVGRGLVDAQYALRLYRILPGNTHIDRLENPVWILRMNRPQVSPVALRELKQGCFKISLGRILRLLRGRLGRRIRRRLLRRRFL